MECGSKLKNLVNERIELSEVIGKTWFKIPTPKKMESIKSLLRENQQNNIPIKTLENNIIKFELGSDFKIAGMNEKLLKMKKNLFLRLLILDAEEIIRNTPKPEPKKCTRKVNTK